MFREAYIRDNNKIKPDDDFLARLKESVSQEEEKVVHIGEYSTITECENVGETKQSYKKLTGMLVAAACFVCVCSAVLIVGNENLFGDGKGLSTHIDSVIDKPSDIINDSNNDTTTISAECQEQYEKAYDLFLKNNTIIYQTEEYNTIESEEDVQVILKNATELSHSKRDGLVGDILAKTYSLTDNTDNFDETEYYIAKFEDGSYVCFLISAQDFIYIENVFEVQGLAFAK